MIPSDIIAKKRNGYELSSNDLSWFIKKYFEEYISEAQMSALLMAIYFKGMTEKELVTLVREMINSGQVIKFKKSNIYIADKHSTGGVGDKTSIILAPIMAAAGIRIPMIAGRSLEYTGGTIDKLEAIPGMNVTPSLNKFKSWVKNIGCAIISQSKDICPADNKIYALRNQTATVPSLPIICSSIMSKKIAEGISGLVMDIKVGNGAFMKTLEQAQELGKALSSLGKDLSINSKYIITDMNQPLGTSSGLWCEVKESIDFLKNKTKDSRLKSVVYKICTIALKMAGRKDIKHLIDNSIESGKAYEVFDKMVHSHRGDINKSFKINLPKHKLILKAEKNGYINKIDTKKLGYTLLEIGGGRKTSLDKIDPTCGLYIRKKINQKVEINEPIIEIFGSNKSKVEIAKKMLNKTISICDKERNKENKIIYE